MNVQSRSSLTRRQQVAAAAASRDPKRAFSSRWPTCLSRSSSTIGSDSGSSQILDCQALIFSLASFPLLLTWFHSVGPGDYYVQKAIPYAMGIYFVALAIVLLPEPKAAPESTESQTTDPIGAVVVP